MIVEEEDALDVFDHVAEEVVIDEVNDDDQSSGNASDNPFKHYTEVVSIPPSQLNYQNESESSSVQHRLELPVNCNSHDNNNGNEEKNNVESLDSGTGQAPFFTSTTSTTAATTANTDDSEPIYLSDSLSCFDSDSDTQQDDLDFAIAQHKIGTRKNAGDRSDVLSDQQASAIDEMDTLNLSTDDVIIVQPEYVEPIEVDQSDSDDERFASKYAFEPFVESDSQPTSDTVSKRGGRGTKTALNASVASAATITATSSFDDTTTDADDDLSEDRRGTRSRRDNVVRKNYSTRRTYARRKLNELNHEAKNENCSDDNELKNGESPLHSHQMDNGLNDCFLENETKSKSMQNNETGTDEDCNLLNVMTTKAPPRTYVARKGAPSKMASCNSNPKSSAGATSAEQTLNAQNENTAHSSGTRGSRGSRSSSNDSKAKSTVTNATMNPMPRKRGRPRKNPAAVENSGIKLCETTDETVIEPSPGHTTALPLAKTEIEFSTDEINGPTESTEPVPDTTNSQKSNECRAKAITNDTTPDQTQFELDRECPAVICTDEIDSNVSSTEISTVSVQQSQNNDKNLMDIELTKKPNDQSVEACKNSDDTEINAMETEHHCSESKPLISK